MPAGVASSRAKGGAKASGAFGMPAGVASSRAKGGAKPDQRIAGSGVTLGSLFSGVRSKPAVILLLVPVLLSVWVYYGKQANLNGFFGWERFSDDYGTVYEYLSAFLLMFCIPVFFVRVLFRERLRDFGLQAGDSRLGVRLMAAIPVMAGIAYLASAGADMQAAYPLAKSAAGHPARFACVELFYLVYYLGWEFFFRGFMLFGLEKRIGPLLALLIQVIPSTIVHIGKPAAESFGAILGGLLFGVIALRTRSIWYPLILHATLGIGTDLFILLRTH